MYIYTYIVREKQLMYMHHTFPDPDFPAQTFMESKSSLNPLAFKIKTTEIFNTKEGMLKLNLDLN